MRENGVSKARKSLIFWISMLIVALVIAIIVAIYSVRDDAQSRSESKKEHLNACLETSKKAYEKEWGERVTSLGAENNLLPSDDAKFIDDRYKAAKDDCYRYYEAIK